MKTAAQVIAEFNDAEELVFRRVDTAIKFVGDPAEGRVGGYLVVWGSPAQKDLQGEYFTPETDFSLDWYNLRPALYHHGLDEDLQPPIVGLIDSIKPDQTGLWAEARLDINGDLFVKMLTTDEQVKDWQSRQLATRQRYAQAVAGLVDKGALGWSSGSIPHMVQVGPDGQIKYWPIVEGSLTPTPAEPRRTTIRSLKSALNIVAAKESSTIEQSTDTSANNSAQVDTTRIDVMDPTQIQACLTTLLQALAQTRPDLQLTPDEINQLVATTQQALTGTDMSTMSAPQVYDAATPIMGKAFREFIEQKDGAARATQDALKRAQQNFLSSVPPTPAPRFTGAGGNGQNGSGHRIPGQFDGMGQLDRRFDHMKATEMALGYVMLKKLKKNVSDEYLTAMAFKTAQLVERDDKVANDWAVKSQLPAIKANEVMQVNLANFGADYAHTYFSSEVWQMVRQDCVLYDRMLAKDMDEKEVPAGYKSDTVPLESSDMTWYNAGAGSTDEDTSSGNVTPNYASSKMGSDAKEVTLARLSARGFWQKELEEDSIVDIVAEARRKILVSGKEQIENVLANGDTATSANTNINLIDSTPAAAPNAPAYTLLDGLAKLPLVTNTANLYNATNTLTEGVYLNLLPLLGTDGKYAGDPDRILFLVTNGVYFASLALAVLKTQDVFPNATIVEGALRKIWGIELLRSAQFGNAQANGKVSVTAGNNTFGRILLVRPDQWATRWKREIEIFMTFDDNAYVTRLTAHMRWGAKNRDNDASAMARNINNTIAA